MEIKLELKRKKIMISKKNINARKENLLTLEQVKKFLKFTKDTKYEIYIKLILAYQFSKLELMSLEWQDVDFENDRIEIHPISYTVTNKFYYSWYIEKLTEFKRTFPLLPHIKKLLLELKEQQELDFEKHGDDSNINYVCLKKDGSRMNVNTLSRNIRYLCRDNDLPEVLVSGLRLSLEGFICNQSRDYDYYRAWTRFDHKFNKPKNTYNNYNLFKNKRFLTALNNLLDCSQMDRKSKSEMEM
ncbi:MAG: hypothetical protein EOM55_02635 [Clostridia bacterium]|nr:hypothetical protein [Clostridia bacterium]